MPITLEDANENRADLVHIWLKTNAILLRVSFFHAKRPTRVSALYKTSPKLGNTSIRPTATIND